MPLALIALLQLALVQPPPSASPEATPREIQRLQDDLKNLDELLLDLEPGDASTERFRARARVLEEDLVYLKVKMRRHQTTGDTSTTGVGQDEVDRARRDAADLRQDIERAFGATAGALTLPAGTEFAVRLEKTLSSKTARVEDAFEATVYEPVMSGSALALPAGTTLRGIVRSVSPAERPSKAGRLDLDLYAVYLGDTKLEVRGRVVDVGSHPRKGTSPAKKAGIGAVLGGVLGAVLSGGGTVVVGIVVGGAGAVLGTKGEEVSLPEGTVLTVRLDRPLDLPPGEGPR
ncbi:MAG TPA: hypothetical protein VMV21_18060 [Vicinamibacteria bacterium]|nr:hypothetical protein [Vicinamibacteria bacterium]